MDIFGRTIILSTTIHRLEFENHCYIKLKTTDAQFFFLPLSLYIHKLLLSNFCSVLESLHKLEALKFYVYLVILGALHSISVVF